MTESIPPLPLRFFPLDPGLSVRTAKAIRQILRQEIIPDPVFSDDLWP